MGNSLHDDTCSYDQDIQLALELWIAISLELP